MRAPQWKPFLAFTRVIYHQTVFFFCMCARILSLSLPLPSFIDFQRRLGVLQEENKNPTLFIGIYACNVMWYMVRICNNHRMPWCTILLHLHSNDWGILYNALQESWIATCAFLIQLQTIKASLYWFSGISYGLKGTVYWCREYSRRGFSLICSGRRFISFYILYARALINKVHLPWRLII